MINDNYTVCNINYKNIFCSYFLCVILVPSKEKVAILQGHVHNRKKGPLKSGAVRVFYFIRP